MFNGVSWKDDDEILFEDHTVLVFNNPTDSSVAAISSIEEEDVHLDDHALLEHFDTLKLPDLDPTVRAHMDFMDIQIYEQK